MSTPVRRQYLALKAVHPEALLFFRMGDFYELFDGDAEIVSRELQLTLTGREFAKGQRSPMAGVPYQHAEAHIARLVERGYRIALADQIGDPKQAKGLVERRIVRLITPGTIIEPHLLAASQNNYLAAILVVDGSAGLAYADISTGEFVLQQLTGAPIEPALHQELLRIGAAECIWPQRAVQPPLLPPAEDPRPAAEGIGGGYLLAPEFAELAPIVAPGCAMTPFPEMHFGLDTARATLARHAGLASLEGQAYAPFSLAVAAGGALLAYLRHTGQGVVSILRAPVLYRAAEHMVLDAPTRRNLELTHTMRGGVPSGSLLAVLDRTRTPMGGRLLRRWLNAPLLVLSPLLRRQEAVGALVGSTSLRLAVGAALAGIGDIDRLVSRAQQGNATPRDLLSLARALERLDALARSLSGFGEPGRVAAARSAAAEPVGRGEDPALPGAGGTHGDGPSMLAFAPSEAAVGAGSDDAPNLAASGASLAAIAAALDGCEDVIALVRAAFVDEPPAGVAEGGYIRHGYAAAIDDLDEGSREAREWLAALEAGERARTGIRGLKVVFNRISGYALEVGKAHIDQVPPEYVRKQTVAGAERYVTPELRQREAQLLEAQERRSAIEIEILTDVRRSVAVEAERMLRSADAVAQADVYAALAMVALEGGYCRPQLDDGDEIAIEGGRHPVVEVAQREVAFVPNDTLLSAESRLVVLTGPNMAGKSTYLRQVALIVLLAQVGSYVPASAARIGLVDRIFTRVGAQDDLAAGQSTFMVEMAETSAILAACTPRSLLILDEIGRGTSTYDGLAIAQAVLEYLHDDQGHRAKTIFATHYHELTALAERRPHVANFRMEVLEEGDLVVFLRRVVPGGADKSYGIHVAELAGLPAAVVRRARALLREYEQNGQATRAARRRIRETAADLQLPLFGDGPGA